MEISSRKTIFDKLSNYDALSKGDDFIEITQWTNQEGFDIQINENKRISLTYGELDAINYLVKSLDYQK